MVDLEEIYSMLSRAERQVNVQNRLIRDLTDISHIQDGKLELTMEPCNLTNIVISTIEDLRSAYPHRAINLALQTDGMIPILADSERISQVISNYVTNALKFSPADRPVTVGLELPGKAARVSVRDEGPGLTPVEQEQVWERFSKIKSIKAQKGFSTGLGLGLHICRAIVEEHKGRVGVESIKGVGSTFWFSLPLPNDSSCT
jgi:signal transduction histidine kinase